MHTKIIPSPLNKGKRITDGTFPARLVMIKLIEQSEAALPSAQSKTVLLSFVSSVP